MCYVALLHGSCHVQCSWNPTILIRIETCTYAFQSRIIYGFSLPIITNANMKVKSKSSTRPRRKHLSRGVNPCEVYLINVYSDIFIKSDKKSVGMRTEVFHNMGWCRYTAFKFIFNHQIVWIQALLRRHPDERYQFTFQARHY